MFEARLAQAALLKKILDAVRDIVQEANFEVTAAGLKLDALDSSHVCLCQMHLRADGFEHYRCDRSRQLGINIGALGKVIRCAGNDDRITLKADDIGDTMTVMFESPGEDKISTFELRLMDIDAEALGFGDSQYGAMIKMPSSEFQRVCRDLSIFDDAVYIQVTKEGVRFAMRGSVGTAVIMIKQHAVADKPKESVIIELAEPVQNQFASRFLVNFGKGAPLSDQVMISMGTQAPLTITYAIDDIGRLQYHLAPKADDDDAEEDEGTGTAD